MKFYRYPDTDNLADRRYFRAFPIHGKSCVYLHRVIWEHENGDIPDKHTIHHIDEDTLNNSIDNLECIHQSDHMSMHSKKHLSVPENKKRLSKHLENIRPLASKWHKSEEGRAWHSEHSRKIAESLQPMPHICEFCGDEYLTKKLCNSRFCSNACKSAWRRKTGVDIIDRICSVCGETFRINKYFKTETCSRKCSGKLISDAMKDRRKKEKEAKVHSPHHRQINEYANI